MSEQSGANIQPGSLSEKQVVYVPEVISALKCAFSEALKVERGSGRRHRLDGKVAKVTLILQIVDTTDTNAGVSGKIPVVLAFGAGGSVSPSFGGGIKKTNTVKTTLAFRLRLSHEAQYRSACEIATARLRRAYGFERWLATVINGLEANTNYAPAGNLDSVSFSGSFGVETNVQGGAEFDIVFVSGDLNLTSTRNDVQQIDFTIQAPDDKVKMPTNTPGDSQDSDLLDELPNY